MKIDETLIILNSAHSKKTVKYKKISPSKIIKPEVGKAAVKNSLIQLSDYLHVKHRTTKPSAPNSSWIDSTEDAQKVLELTKSIVSQEPLKTFKAQANQQFSAVISLLR